jgi:hypothetical protein
VAFAFEITRVDRLPFARVGVLDGKVLEGKVSSKATVELIHGEQRIPLQLMGVVIGSRRPRTDGLISLTADLRQPAMKVVQEGDRLVAA